MLVSVTAFKEWILESPAIFWRTQTFNFQVPPGTCSSCTARRAIVFLWFLSGSVCRLMHQESYEKFCFVGISCTVLHTKAVQAIQLTQLLEPADDFPNTDQFGNFCFSHTALCYILCTCWVIWFGCIFFHEPSQVLQTTTVFPSLTLPAQGEQNFDCQEEISSYWDLVSLPCTIWAAWNLCFAFCCVFDICDQMQTQVFSF